LSDDRCSYDHSSEECVVVQHVAADSKAARASSSSSKMNQGASWKQVVDSDTEHAEGTGFVPTRESVDHSVKEIGSHCGALSHEMCSSDSRCSYDQASATCLVVQSAVADPRATGDSSPSFKINREASALWWWIVVVGVLICCTIAYFVYWCKGGQCGAMMANVGYKGFAMTVDHSPSSARAAVEPDLEATDHHGAFSQPRANPASSHGVPMVWDTPQGERTVYATQKPLGVQFRREFPLKVKHEPEGHGKELGVKVGWVLKSVNGVDVTGPGDYESVVRLHGKKQPCQRDISQVSEVLYKEVGVETTPFVGESKPGKKPPLGVPLVWDTQQGERTVYATKKPLGVRFHAEFPLKVKHEPVGHGKELGIEMGWILKSVNGTIVTGPSGFDPVLRLHGRDASCPSDLKTVDEVLYREVGVKTEPLESTKDP